MATKCKGLLCLLALLFLLAGFTFTSCHSQTIVLETVTSPHLSSQSTCSAQSLTLPTVAANAPDQHEAAPVIQHSPDHPSIYYPIGATCEQSLFYSNIRKQLSTCVLLLPVIARTLGLSTLVLRE